MKDHDKHYGIEEEFYARDRKQFRKERKIASLKDRSKYKKSDQDQLKKRQPQSAEELSDSMMRGRVLAITPEGIVVDSLGKLFTCSLKGALKKERQRIKNLIAVGDFVHFEPNGIEHGVIVSIGERHSILSRADSLVQKREQLIAVNIDQVLITASVVSPRLKPFLIDRYVIAAHKGNMTPIIIVNKIDLLQSPPHEISESELQEEKALWEEFQQVYRDLDVQVIAVSATTGEGIDELKKAMEGKTSVFSGQSGVGKSSLINAVTGHSLAIGKVVEKTQKGSHTTTAAHLIPTACGGFCIDTPGIRSFGIWELTAEDIQENFPEINALSHKCKYLDCTHMQEPECAVQQALHAGQISPLRFASYCALMTGLDEKLRLR